MSLTLTSDEQAMAGANDAASGRVGVKVIELVETMRNVCRQLARDGKQIRLVPTMGCLHVGHASLIKRARVIEPATTEATVITIVSIFINPLQFNNENDFDKYPKTFETDLKLCQTLGVDYVFAPKCADIYPTRGAGNKPKLTNCCIEPPEHLANDLEGKSRPGHFRGMLTIVNKLFNIIRPHAAYFGEKDYQQLVLVKDMVESLNMDIEICPVQTVRDSNKLPLSSRNSRLSDEHKLAASIMFDILDDARRLIEESWGQFFLGDHEEAGENLPCLDSALLASTLAASCLKSALLKCNINCTDSTSSLIEFDYLELRCATDLTKIAYKHDFGAFDCLNGCIKTRNGGNLILKARLLISIVIANVRLLDNIEVRLNLQETTQL